MQETHSTYIGKQVIALKRSYKPVSIEDVVVVNFEKTHNEKFLHDVERDGSITILVPYCTQQLHLYVTYSRDSRLPDIFWDSEYQDFNPQINFEDILSNLDSDEMLLCRTVEAFSEEFTKYNERQLNPASKLADDLKLLCTDPCISTELFNFKKKDGFQSKLLIHKPIDTTKITTQLTGETINFDVFFAFNFPSSDYTNCKRIATQINYSNSFKRFLADHNLTITHKDFVPASEHLVQYIDSVFQAIYKKFDSLSENSLNRQEYIAELISIFGGNVMEYDSINHRYVFLLIEWNDFFFILEVHLQDTFPHSDRPPFMALRSVYHGETGCPIRKEYPNQMPHSPRWSYKEMVARLYRWLPVILPEFQQHSIRGTNI